MHFKYSASTHNPDLEIMTINLEEPQSRRMLASVKFLHHKQLTVK